MSHPNPAAAQPTTPALSPAHRKMVVVETIVSTAINALIPTAIIYALALKPPAGIGGPDGQALTFGRATVLATFLMSLIVTALVRGRLAKGVAEPRPAEGWSRRLPRPIVLRALAFTAAALVTVLPIGVLAAQAVGLAGFDRIGLAAFNLFFGSLIGVGVTPWVVLAALSDAPRPKP